MIRFKLTEKLQKQSPVRCLDPEAEQKMMNAIDAAKENGIPLVELWK